MKLTDMFKWNSILFMHVVVWTVLFIVPLLYAVDNAAASKFAMRNCVMLCGLMVTFYANYVWGFDKLLFKRRYWLFVLFNIALFAILWVTRGLANSLIDSLGDAVVHHKRHDGFSSIFVFNDIVFSLLAISASFGIKHISAMHQIEMERKKLENETLTSELSLLKYQIQPHFFFNCLNNIYSLIGNSPKDAQKSIHSLSKMMRYVLYDSSSNILLSKDIDFLKNYISLMRLKLSPEARLTLSFPEDTGDVFVPSLLFIPLVENAFKHGVGSGGRADISCVMSFSGSSVTFIVENEMFSSEPVEDRSHSGIGLVNLRKRLDILYADKYKFETTVSCTDREVFRAEIVIPVAQTSNHI